MPTPKLNGLELLKRVKDGIFPHPTMAATIPMKIISVEKGPSNSRPWRATGI
jgi:hypothetical protein